jgi:hypothetical protein
LSDHHDHLLDQRKKGLEEAFFTRHNRDVLERLRHKVDEAKRREHLISISGIKDPKLLDRLVKAGLDSESLAALGLIPLLHVAWADGKVQPQERSALLDAAKRVELHEDSPGHQLLTGWFDQEPDPQLFQVWKEYVRALKDAMAEDTFAAVRNVIVDRARTVARAAGGIVGVGAVTGTEHDAIKEIEAALR